MRFSPFNGSTCKLMLCFVKTLEILLLFCGGKKNGSDAEFEKNSSSLCVFHELLLSPLSLVLHLLPCLCLLPNMRQVQQSVSCCRKLYIAGDSFFFLNREAVNRGLTELPCVFCSLTVLRWSPLQSRRKYSHLEGVTGGGAD